MSPRPRFTSKIDSVRNAVLGVLLVPFRWFSPTTRFAIGFAFLTISTTLLLIRWPFSFLRTVVVFILAGAAYFIVWRVVKYRSANVDLLVSPARAFALVGSAILFEAILMRLGFVVANAIASQSTRAPFNDSAVWGFTIPFAAASLLLTMLLDRQLSLIAGIVASGFAGLLATEPWLMAPYAFISCAAAVYGIKRYRERQSVTARRAVRGRGKLLRGDCVNGFFQRPLSISGALVAGLFGVGGGLLTIIFAAGGVPINESLFGILTDIRLLELTNADLPVLSQLALRAPGTNQHSHAVGQLAEDACRAIRANVLLARARRPLP